MEYGERKEHTDAEREKEDTGIEKVGGFRGGDRDLEVENDSERPTE